MAECNLKNLVTVIDKLLETKKGLVTPWNKMSSIRRSTPTNYWKNSTSLCIYLARLERAKCLWRKRKLCHDHWVWPSLNGCKIANKNCNRIACTQLIQHQGLNTCKFLTWHRIQHPIINVINIMARVNFCNSNFSISVDESNVCHCINLFTPL